MAKAGVVVPDPFFTVSGANAIQTVGNTIEVATDLGSLSMSGIVAYQGIESDVRPVAVATTAQTIGFRVQGVAATSPLTIDPVVYARAIFGSADEAITSIKQSADGNVVVGGWTTSADIDTPSGAAGAGTDGFVAVLTPDLQTVLYWAYIGGDSLDAVRSIGVTASGQVWATGETNSPGLPFPSSVISGAHSGTVDGFVVRLSPDLATIVNGMYIAGNGVDLPLGISVGGNGEVAVVGQTNSTLGMPSGSGYSDKPLGQQDGFVLGLAADGARVKSFTYFGSLNDEAFTCVAQDAVNNIVVGGWTNSNEYKTWPEKVQIWIPPDDEKGEAGYYKEFGSNPYDVEFNGGSTDGILAKFSNTGELIFSTYFGGSAADVINGVTTDGEDDVYAVGTSNSQNLPVIDGSSLMYRGQDDAFVTVISKDGLRLRTCGYHGGSGNDMGYAIALDAMKNIFIAGSSTSFDMESYGAGATTVSKGGTEGFVAKMTKTSVLFSTLLGWRGDDVPMAMTLDSRGDIYLGGHTTSVLPSSTQKQSSESVQAEAMDALVLKYAFGTVTVRTPDAGTVLCGGTQTKVSWLTQDLPSTETYSVDVSGDKGASWTEIATDLRIKNTDWMVPTEAPDSGSYQFRVRTIRGHASLSTEYAVGLAPQITEQPATTWLCPNASHELTVTAQGEGTTYQWYKDGSSISGATTSSLMIASASASDAGTYHVVLTNACSSLQSESAMVTVAPAPVIEEQPKSTTLNAGQTLTLSVTAQGPGLSYQWQRNGVDVPAPAGTSASLVIENVNTDHQGSYACVVTSECGVKTSETASVSITTGVDEDVATEQAVFSIAPQPALDYMSVTMTNGATLSGVTLFDMRGRVIVQLSYTDVSEATLSTTAVPSGAYSMVLQTSQGLHTRLIVVQ